MQYLYRSTGAQQQLLSQYNDHEKGYNLGDKFEVFSINRAKVQMKKKHPKRGINLGDKFEVFSINRAKVQMKKNPP